MLQELQSRILKRKMSVAGNSMRKTVKGKGSDSRSGRRKVNSRYMLDGFGTLLFPEDCGECLILFLV
jgi:hypothetical protein